VQTEEAEPGSALDATDVDAGPAALGLELAAGPHVVVLRLEPAVPALVDRQARKGALERRDALAQSGLRGAVVVEERAGPLDRALERGEARLRVRPGLDEQRLVDELGELAAPLAAHRDGHGAQRGQPCPRDLGGRDR